MNNVREIGAEAKRDCPRQLAEKRKLKGKC